jgi:hypothetical protein
MKTILHVGYTATNGDLQRTCQVLRWLSTRELLLDDIEPVFIDLNEGQDFLAMTETYDIVVLHFICREEKRHRIERNETRPELTISPHASWSNWRKRLVSTQAQYIFLFGGMGEVGYSFICNLDGYRAEQVEDEFWVFIKMTAVEHQYH